MFEDIFQRKRAVLEKLEAYGFKRTHGMYQYDTDILNGVFHLKVIIEKNSIPDTKLVEIATGEEYILYRTDAVGKYVGEIRAAVAPVLQDIADQCYAIG